MSEEPTVMLDEVYGSEALESIGQRYVKSREGKLVVLKRKDRLLSVSQFFRTVFLPLGYPDSVSSDYLTYQIWDTIQAFASSITNTLAHQAVLKGVGVGDESATVLAATLTWLLKDGTGMMGRIMFAWLQGSNLDCDPKRWRLFADIINDMAIFLEILAPHFPGLFVLIICVAGVLKSIVGVAAGATRAALTQHQARRNNMADVSAKDGSQETLVNLAALLCSLVLVPIVTGKHMLIWTLFVLFTSLHLYANYSAVTSVVMESINQGRLHIILQEFFKSGTIQSTESVNGREPVLWSTRRKLNINLGSSVGKICSSSDDVSRLQGIYRNSRYLLDYDSKTGEINIVLHRLSSVRDQLQSCYQAQLLEYLYRHREQSQNLQTDLRLISDAMLKDDTEVVSLSYLYTCRTFDHFEELLHQHGWKTDVALLGADEWRADWDFVNGLPVKKDV